ncbi:cell division protein FtsL [Allosediminivita pacifica]|uniref:Cell division protein FtsL n=1 Tax=Allosediminivita pacifica TaxID=1267769 RepID=A0A2T6B0Y9_9RHOB|nr:cell division protein FtsL [Allosediminivita pacifica]PTX49756.1 hypothetical protein C8N44_106134 [Allosediminivita pacifica]GGB04375.1 cell division protein FtsL [Allosediminivita pacifica]
MRLILFVLVALAVIASGFWAYRENYATQAALEDVRATRTAIADARDRLAVLKAEWAYLNRPDRLRDLADLNYDKLGLSPLRSGQFGRIDQVAYPQPELNLSMSEPISFSTAGARP